MNRSLVAVLVGLSIAFAGGRDQAVAAEVARTKLYDVVTEIGMPHLDENLRYATIREQRCLDTGNLARAFPVLNDVSLRDCSLGISTQQTDGAVYTLQCTGGHGTTGSARWQFEGAKVDGVLNVKLGGKNMTFYQRIVGRAIGPCPDIQSDVTP